MWRFLYRLLAWMSGGPTIEDYKEACDLYFRGVKDRSKLMNREADLSRRLGEAHAKITELESDCDSFCEAIDGLLQKQESLKKELEIKTLRLDVKQQTIEAWRENYAVAEGARDRWQTACNTMQQQRDEALEHLAAIQEQTAKYVRT